MIKVNGLGVSRIPINGKETLRVMKNGKQLWSGTGLPSGYTLLEYIESTGTQYIDTGVVPNQDTRIEIDTLVYPSDVACLFGSRVGANYNLYYCDAGGTSFQYGSYASYITVMPRNTRTKVVSYKGVITGNGVQYGSLNYNYFTCSDSLCLLYDRYAYYASAKIYSSQIYDNGTLVRDFIPCMNPQGICGLFDKVNKQFYGSASLTPFTGA